MNAAKIKEAVLPWIYGLFGASVGAAGAEAVAENVKAVVEYGAFGLLVLIVVYGGAWLGEMLNKIVDRWIKAFDNISREIRFQRIEYAEHAIRQEARLARIDQTLGLSFEKKD